MGISTAPNSIDTLPNSHSHPIPYNNAQERRKKLHSLLERRTFKVNKIKEFEKKIEEYLFLIPGLYIFIVNNF